MDLFWKDEVEVYKNNGFWRVRGVDWEECDYIYINNRAFRFRDQPEVVVYALDKYPELESFIDGAYYRKWVEALNRTEEIKERESFKFSHPFKMEPYAHQKKALAFALSIPCAALFMDPGTGKTFTSLAAAEIRKRQGLIDKTLVVAPASVLYTGWYRDMQKFTEMTGHILSKKKMRWTCEISGKSYTRYDWACKRAEKEGSGPVPLDLLNNELKTLEEKLLGSDQDIYFASIDIVRANVDLFKKINWGKIILDESTMIKNPTGKRREAMQKLGNDCQFKMILTGTPNVGNLEDYWAQMKFLDHSLDDTIGQFRDRYIWQNPQVEWMKKPKRGAQKKIIQRIRNRCFRITKDECLDLPPRTTMVREVEPTPTIKKHYRAFHKSLYTLLEDNHEVTAFNPMTEVLRLHQIINGYVTEGLDVHEIEKTNKVKVVKEILDENPDESVIIWCIYRNDFSVLQKTFEKYGVSTINGSTSNGDKQDELFSNGTNRIMLAHPKSVKFGKTWTHSTVTIFYTYSYSLEDYLQARDRNYRIGQKRKVLEYFLTSGGIEDKIIDSLMKKQDFSAQGMQDLQKTLNALEL